MPWLTADQYLADIDQQGYQNRVFQDKVMWIFGYGSLMWDQKWQNEHGCLHAEVADIQGYRRVFNKPSVVNRGTAENPAPTLNLVADANAICTGLAIEFPDHAIDTVLADLASRENGYTRHMRTVRLYQSVLSVRAHVYIYEQADVIQDRGCEQIAQMAILAKGTRGSGRDYIVNTAMELQRLGITDPEVTRVYQALRRQTA